MDLFKTVCASARVPQVRGELAKQPVLSSPHVDSRDQTEIRLGSMCLKSQPSGPTKCNYDHKMSCSCGSDGWQASEIHTERQVPEMSLDVELSANNTLPLGMESMPDSLLYLLRIREKVAQHSALHLNMLTVFLGTVRSHRYR